MPGRPVRWVATLVVVAMVAAACTETDADTTSTVVRNSPEAKAMIDSALGGTQAVQDFVVHLELGAIRHWGTESIYQDVLALAATEVGDPVELAGGLTFTPVESIEAGVIDADGKALPTIAVDFGILSFSEGAFGAARSSIIEAIPGDETVLLGLIDALPSVGSGLLIEVITADFAQARTHVGPGDRTAIDLTQISSIAPGDKVTSIHIFGQTLPGDPHEEAGLNAAELFSYRWNRGLVSLLGKEDGSTLVHDEGLMVVDGSTILTREAKHALLAGVFFAGMDEALEAYYRALPDFTGQNHPGAHGIAEVAAGDGWQVTIEIDQYSPAFPLEVYLCLYVIGLDGTAGGRKCISIEHSPQAVLATFVGILRCAELAGEMNRRNQGAGIPISEVREALGLDTEGPDPQTPGDPDPNDPSDPPEPPDPLPSCSPPDPPLPPFPPLGALLGDVHVRTFDRLAYSNQAAGEFLLFENGMTTIQMRTEPVDGNDSVSTATALALRIGERSVSLHAGGETWIDGDLAQLTRGEAVAVGDAALLWWKGGWVAVWSDGTRLEVQDRGSDLAAFVSPSAGPVVGMLGDGNGDPADDLVSRSGDLFQVPPRPSGGYDDAFYESFYATYVDSWRITQEEALFHYGPGESTATFTIEGFPARYARVSALDPLTRVDAEQACRKAGVTREDVLEDCTLDVGLTGDKGFAYIHYLVESRTEDAVRGPDGAGPLAPGDGDSIFTFGILTVDFGPDSPLRDPSRTSRWECSAEEGQFRAFSAFAESPTRSFEVTVLYGSASTNPTGNESFAVVVRLNAEDHAWTGLTIDDIQPFNFDALDFDGTTLIASGTGYLNQPPLPNAFPLVVPQGGEVTRFALRATCG